MPQVFSIMGPGSHRAFTQDYLDAYKDVRSRDRTNQELLI